jgi:hypothetical protein
MITAKKNAPSLAARGKSTFSEGGVDNRCVQKSTLVRNCKGVLLRRSKCRHFNLQKRADYSSSEAPRWQSTHACKPVLGNIGLDKSAHVGLKEQGIKNGMHSHMDRRHGHAFRHGVFG